jgi:hypothetical protein
VNAMQFFYHTTTQRLRGKAISMASSKKFVLREITRTTPTIAKSDNCGTCALPACAFGSFSFTISPANSYGHHINTILTNILTPFWHNTNYLAL